MATRPTRQQLTTLRSNYAPDCWVFYGDAKKRQHWIPSTTSTLKRIQDLEQQLASLRTKLVVENEVEIFEELEKFNLNETREFKDPEGEMPTVFEALREALPSPKEAHLYRKQRQADSRRSKERRKGAL